MESKTFTFDSLPKSVDELKALPESALTDPFEAAALTVLALCEYEENAAACIDMLNLLKGPQPLSPFEVQFLRDRLVGKSYVPRSYFNGTSPQNNYEPSRPYSLTVFDGPYSYKDQGYAMLYIRSSGADSQRQIKLRAKGDQWFLWENYLLPDIRKPAGLDPWA